MSAGSVGRDCFFVAAGAVNRLQVRIVRESLGVAVAAGAGNDGVNAGVGQLDVVAIGARRRFLDGKGRPPEQENGQSHGRSHRT
jgi:hypothetical protein